MRGGCRGACAAPSGCKLLHWTFWGGGGVRLRVWGVGLRVSSLGLWLGSRVSGLGFGVWGLRFEIWGVGFGLELGVWG